MTTSTVQNPSFSFPAPGTYNVKLTVTDNDGAQDTIVIPVVVSAALVGEVFHCDFDTDKLYKIDPVTLANLSGAGVTSPGTESGGIGGTDTEVFHCDSGTGKLYKIDPVTLANLSGAGVSSPGISPNGIGGTKP